MRYFMIIQITNYKRRIFQKFILVSIFVGFSVFGCRHIANLILILIQGKCILRKGL